MYKHIVFDVDGTLIDANEPILMAMQETWEEKTGEKRSLEDFHFIIGIPGEVSLQKLNYQGDFKDFGRLWGIKVRAHADRIRVFDGIREALQELKQGGVCLSVVTSRTRGELQEVFDAFDLWPYFNYSITADMTEKHKPNPDPMLKLLELSGDKAEEVIYIGDTAHDMACAKGAGAGNALALWGASDDKILADRYLKHPRDILPLVCR